MWDAQKVDTIKAKWAQIRPHKVAWPSQILNRYIRPAHAKLQHSTEALRRA